MSLYKPEASWYFCRKTTPENQVTIKHMCPTSYTHGNYREYCDTLAQRDDRLRQILARHGYPSFWHRDPGFPCLIRIILEQQVSLASAYATYAKLENRIGIITPEAVLELSDEALKECGFSRQKTTYARTLATAVQSGELDLDALSHASDSEIHSRLIRIKGIGEWTISIYLLLSLHRLDIFPLGDLALVKSLRSNGFCTAQDSRETIQAVARTFSPYRSIFAIMLWHSYIEENNITVP